MIRSEEKKEPLARVQSQGSARGDPRRDDASRVAAKVRRPSATRGDAQHRWEAGVKVAMHRRSRWIDNRRIGRWIDDYNAERPHSTYGIVTPNEAYEAKWVDEKKQPETETDPPWSGLLSGRKPGPLLRVSKRLTPWNERPTLFPAGLCVRSRNDSTQAMGSSRTSNHDRNT